MEVASATLLQRCCRASNALACCCIRVTEVGARGQQRLQLRICPDRDTSRSRGRGLAFMMALMMNLQPTAERAAMPGAVRAGSGATIQLANC